MLLCTISSAHLDQKRRGAYGEEYVEESYLDCRTVVEVLLGLDLDDEYLGYGSYDVVGDCSFLALDRVFRVV